MQATKLLVAVFVVWVWAITSPHITSQTQTQTQT